MTPEIQEPYFAQFVGMYHRLGNDFVPVRPTLLNHPPPRRRVGQDTADLSRGERAWVEEGAGLITSREEFEAFPWDDIKGDPTPCQIVARVLPPGMKIAVRGSYFEHVMETLLGMERLFYLLYDQPDLVHDTFERWGQIIYQYYEAVIGMEQVGAIFHADDLGFKTSTLLSAKDLRRLVLPWFKEYAALAHRHGKPFWLHCCGNIYRNGIIDDLIDDVKVDVLHSFQDEILPVTDFKTRYGQRLAAFGGVDVDKLVRLDEPSLREYIRDMLKHCMPGGRFAFGTGNSVTNYIPLKSYAILLDESRRWQA
jgi:uroporphyrinogen decarboxylase